ncbi:MAG TPA: fluoride efflux transporter CrcB [Acidimicrobiia bacterium]|jgi:CrcB protein|nr:fluoride efflux transporter CrcB [Acidimicrobiia bacterium]
MLLLGIALAGAIGAPARYLVDGLVIDRTEGGLPLGTLLVNISGSFVLGVLTGLALYHAFPSTPKTILGTGFCGAYTTFSTFTYEVVRLAEQGMTRAAARVLGASLVLPALAAALGLALAAL